MQSKIQTWLEVGANIIIGGIIAGLITYSILLLNLDKKQSAFYSTLGCTIWSIIRQYVIRRYFNQLSIKGNTDVKCKFCGNEKSSS